MAADGGDAQADLSAQLGASREQNAVLLERVAALEGLVAALQAQLDRDSSNSGRPPSSDLPFVKRPAAKRSSRTRSGKPQGKQPGAPGTTLRLVDDPDVTLIHHPAACAGCGLDLVDAEVFGERRHQVLDVPAVAPRPHVTEAPGAVQSLSGLRERDRGRSP